MSSSVAVSSCCTASLAYHLRSAGTTYQGASGALVDVARAVLPVLVLAFEAFGKPRLLLLLADVQHDLQHAGTGGGDLLLEAPDGGVPLLHLLRRREPPHAVDQDVLVVGPVEDADHPGLREPPADAPQEVVVLLLLRRCLEGVVLHALGVHEPDDVADDPALARGVHALQDEQDGDLAPGPALGEQLLLKGREHARPGGERRRTLLLAAVEPRRGVRIHCRQREIRPRHQEAPHVGGSAVSARLHGSSCDRAGGQGL